MRRTHGTILLALVLTVACSSSERKSPPESETVQSPPEQATTPPGDSPPPAAEAVTIDEEIPLLEFHVDARNKDHVALTFDDGPDNAGHTLKVLDVLAAKGVHASFFVNTNTAMDVLSSSVGRETVTRIARDGHELGNHSARHLSFRDVSTDVDAELRAVDDVLRALAPLSLERRLVRAPFGEPFFGGQKRLDEVAPVIARHGVHVGWNIDSDDWKCEGAPDCVTRNVLTAIDSGRSGIILLHSTLAATADALPTLIDELRARGKKFVDVEALVADKYAFPSRHLMHCARDTDCSLGDRCGVSKRCVDAVTMEVEPPVEPSATPPSPGWQPMADVAPILAKRVEAATTWDGRRLFVYGGRDAWAPTYYADGAIYNPYENNWRAIPRSPISARAGAAAVAHGGKLYVFGGSNSAYEAMRSAAVYSVASDHWAFLPSAPQPVACNPHAAWSSATEELVVFGCVWNEAARRYEAGGFAYRPSTGAWRRLANAPFAARTGYAFAALGDRLFVWGGADRTTAMTSRGDGAIYDPQTDAWTALPTAPIAARAEVNVVARGGQVILYGGFTTAGARAWTDGAIWDDASTSWEAIPANVEPDAARRYTTTIISSDALLVLGGNVWTGGVEGELATNTLAYDFRTATWKKVESPVSARRRAFAVSANDLAVIWGGDSWGNAVMDGARLGFVAP